MIVVTTPFLAGHRAREAKGMVFGLVVRSRGLGIAQRQRTGPGSRSDPVAANRRASPSTPGSDEPTRSSSTRPATAGCGSGSTACPASGDTAPKTEP